MDRYWQIQADSGRYRLAQAAQHKQAWADSGSLGRLGQAAQHRQAGWASCRCNAVLCLIKRLYYLRSDKLFSFYEIL